MQTGNTSVSSTQHLVLLNNSLEVLENKPSRSESGLNHPQNFSSVFLSGVMLDHNKTHGSLMFRTYCILVLVLVVIWTFWAKSFTS